jgi:hypothetical protein
MSRLESLIVSCFIAVLVPVGLFFAAWWLSVGIVPGRLIPVCAFAGLGAGMLLDLFFLRSWTARAYRMNVVSLAALYIYVSVVTYAVCMGVPVFNLVPGIVAGIYVGRRLRHSEEDLERQAGRQPAVGEGASAAGAVAARGMRRAGLFTAAVIACAAAFSAFIALKERSLASELQHMFRLKFTVTRPMIIGMIAVGGPFLIFVQYWCTTRAARIAYGTQESADSQTN